MFFTNSTFKAQNQPQSGSLTFKGEEYSVLSPFTNEDLNLIKYANKTSLVIVLRIKLRTWIDFFSVRGIIDINDTGQLPSWHMLLTDWMNTYIYFIWFFVYLFLFKCRALMYLYFFHNFFFHGRRIESII